MAPLFPTAGRFFWKAPQIANTASCRGFTGTQPIGRSFSSTAAPSSPAFLQKSQSCRPTAGSKSHARGFKLGDNSSKPNRTPPIIPNVPSPTPKPTLLASILLRKPQFHSTPSLLWSKVFRLGQQPQSPPPPGKTASTTPPPPEILATSRENFQSPAPTPASRNFDLNPGPPPPPFPEGDQQSYHPQPPPPPRSPWSQLLKPTIFAFVTTAGCIAYAFTYRPPPNDKRLFPQVSPEFATVAALIGANVVVFLLWQRPIGGIKGWKLMNRYLATIPGRPEWFSLLGSTFSHLRFIHLAVNCYGLYVFGIQLCGEINRGNFLALYFSSGVLSALASMYWNVYKRRWNVFSIGASGAIMGLVSTYAYCFPDTTFYIMFIPFINFRAWDTVLGLGCLEILGLLRGWMSLDHAAHLGGLVIGYIWAKTYIGDVVKKRREALRRWYGNYGGK